MTILNIKSSTVGEAGINPRIVKIQTNNTESDILTPGFLNDAVSSGESFLNSDLLAITTVNNGVEKTNTYQAQKLGDNVNVLPTGGSVSQFLVTTSNSLNSTTDTSLVNSTLTGSITPRSANSRILVWCDFDAEVNQDSAASDTRWGSFDIYRTSGIPARINGGIASIGRQLVGANAAPAASIIHANITGTEIAGDVSQHDYVLRFGVAITTLITLIRGDIYEARMYIMEIMRTDDE